MGEYPLRGLVQEEIFSYDIMVVFVAGRQGAIRWRSDVNTVLATLIVLLDLYKMEIAISLFVMRDYFSSYIA